MSFETRKQTDSSQPAEKKPSNVSGWVATIAALVLIAIALAFPLRGQIVAFWDMATSGKSASKPAATDTASDQGIGVAVESAEVSGNTSTIVVRFKDEEGKGRISDKVDFGHYSVQVGTNHPYSTISLRDYDAASGEAAYAIAVEGVLSGKRALVDFYSISSGQYNFYVNPIEIDITSALRDNAAAGTFGPLAGDLNGFGAKDANGFAWRTVLTTDSYIGDDAHRPQGDVLAPDAIHVALPGVEEAYLSNIAYKDGILYLQAATPVGDSGECMLSISASSRTTGNSFPRSGDSFAYLYTDADGARLQIYETQCAVSPDELADCVLSVSGFGNRGTVTGSWRVACSFPEEGRAPDEGGSASE